MFTFQTAISVLGLFTFNDILEQGFSTFCYWRNAKSNILCKTCYFVYHLERLAYPRVPRLTPAILEAHVLTCARLTQSVEHETLNLRVVGSSPTLGEICFVILIGIQQSH